MEPLKLLLVKLQEVLPGIKPRLPSYLQLNNSHMKYTPSKKVRSHIAKWEASDFAEQNAKFGGDVIGAKAVELLDTLGGMADSFTNDELDGLLSTYYNLSSRGFNKTIMPYVQAYATNPSDDTKRSLEKAMLNRWTIAPRQFLKGIKRRAAADTALMNLTYNSDPQVTSEPVVAEPDALRVSRVLPLEYTRTSWDDALDVSPYITGKPILRLQPKIQLPDITEMMEGSEWEPTFPQLKPAYKDGKLPGYYIGKTPWGDTEEQKSVQEWGGDWKFRTTRAAGSKVMLKWKAAGSKPKPESSEEYTKRRIQEETKMTPITRAIGKVMDLPTVAHATPGTSTGYATFGQHMPQQQSTVGTEIGAFLDAAFAPQMPGDIVKAYNFVRNIPKKYIAPWMISREMKKSLRETNLKNTGNDMFNGSVGGFEVAPNTDNLENVFDLYKKIKPINSAELFPASHAGLSDLGSAEKGVNPLSNLERKKYPTDKFPDPYAGISDVGANLRYPKLVDNIPTEFNYTRLNGINPHDRFNMFFEKVVDDETKIPYYVVKPLFKNRIKLAQIPTFVGDRPIGKPHGYTFHTDDGIEKYNPFRAANIDPNHNLIYLNKPNRRDLELVLWEEVSDHFPRRFIDEEEFRGRVLPKIYQLEDSWKSAGMPGKKPKLYSEREWDSMSDTDKFNAVFDVLKDPKTGYHYFAPKPYLKGLIRRGGSTFYNAGLKNSAYGDLLLGDIPKEIMDRVVYNEFEVPGIMGYERIPNKHKIVKPTLPEEDLDWSKWREEVFNRLSDDWIKEGPLSQHLTRSGIKHPKVLLNYMLSPEQAWKQLLSKGLGLEDSLFKLKMLDDAIQSPPFLKAFNTELNDILREKSISPINVDTELIPSVIKIKDTLRNHLNSSISTLTPKLKISKLTSSVPGEANFPDASDIFEEAFNRTLKNNKDFAREFYNNVEHSYDNAFASPGKGTMFISPYRKNFTRVVSHELGHLEDVPEGTYEMPGVVESTQLSLRPSAKTPLFKKAFDLSRSGHKEYLGGVDEKDATEMAQRATQIADFLKLKRAEHITPKKLKYAIKNYVENTGMDNNMTDFFKTIIDINAAAKWMDIFHKAIIPTVATGTIGYKSLQPLRKNENKITEYN